MSHSVLTVLTMSKALSKKQSRSCSDITTLTTATKQHQSDSDWKQLRRRNSLVRSVDAGYNILHRFVKPKSPLVERMKKSDAPTSPASTPPDLDDIDQKLIQIREQLSTFRAQDTKLRERLDSLSNSIDELASRSSVASDISDVTMPSGNTSADEEHYSEDDDRDIDDDFKNVSMSLSREVLNCIPAYSEVPQEMTVLR